MWEDMARGIRKVAKVVLGESKGSGPKDKESWWWETNVQEKVKTKRECFKALHSCNNEENREKYRVAKKETRKAVSEAKSKAFEGLYQSLRTKNGENTFIGLLKVEKRRQET